MYRTGIQSPERVWWKPVHGGEKVWVAIAFAWCMVLFAMMPVWHLRGGQNPSGIRHRVEPLEGACCHEAVPVCLALAPAMARVSLLRRALVSPPILMAASLAATEMRETCSLKRSGRFGN